MRWQCNWEYTRPKEITHGSHFALSAVYHRPTPRPSSTRTTPDIFARTFFLLQFPPRFFSTPTVNPSSWHPSRQASLSLTLRRKKKTLRRIFRSTGISSRICGKTFILSEIARRRVERRMARFCHKKAACRRYRRVEHHKKKNRFENYSIARISTLIMCIENRIIFSNSLVCGLIFFLSAGHIIFFATNLPLTLKNSFSARK